jgi:hypothetical protein
MMAMCLFYHISVVQLDSLGQQKKNGDGMIRRIYSLNWILLRVLISMVMVSDLVENELNILLKKSDGRWSRYCSIIILELPSKRLNKFGNLYIHKLIEYGKKLCFY